MMKYRVNLSIDGSIMTIVRAKKINMSKLVNDYMKRYLHIQDNLIDEQYKNKEELQKEIDKIQIHLDNLQEIKTKVERD